MAVRKIMVSHIGSSEVSGLSAQLKARVQFEAEVTVLITINEHGHWSCFVHSIGGQLDGNLTPS